MKNHARMSKILPNICHKTNLTIFTEHGIVTIVKYIMNVMKMLDSLVDTTTVCETARFQK